MHEMSERPKLTLPPRDQWTAPPRRGLGAAVWLLALLLAGVLGLQVYQLVLRPPAAAPAAPAARRSTLPPAELKEVAVRLQTRNLHSAAAAAYEEYLAAADLSGEERGNLLLEVGNLLARAGKYEEALARYFRAERLVPESNLGPLRRKVQECLQRLGKYSEQGHELASQVAPRSASGSPAGAEAGKVVAWIGPEKITSSELDDLISEEIEERAGSIPGLPPERVNELKAQAEKQLSSPQARLGKLQELLARRILYREGLEREVDKSARVEQRVADFNREAVVEEMVLNALRDRIKVSESDLRNFYRANPARYRKRPSAQVRIAVLPTEAKARELLQAARTEDDFARLAGEGSIEEASRRRGGLLEEPVVEGQPVPLLGPAPELEKAIFQTEPSHATGAPAKVPSGFAVAWVRKRTPESAPSFEEVKEQVGKDYLQEKQNEVQSELVKELFAKHQVTVVTEAFLPGAGRAEKKPPEAKTEEKKEAAGDPGRKEDGKK
jgi:parvulin-like peptidyl-prolyl isomerase